MSDKIKFTPEEEMKLEILRKDIDRYQNILRWQKIREAERKLLELRIGTITELSKEIYSWINTS